jgi:hypothetical protein
LVERIVVCWLQLQQADSLSSQIGYATGENGGPDSPPAEARSPAIPDGVPHAGFSTAVTAGGWLAS